MARILIIDDDENARYAVRAILENAGHEVSEAENGAVGLRMQAAHRFDLVISDVIMPEQDGIETVLQLSKDYPSLPVIVISGGGADRFLGYLETAEALGATRILAKPFLPADLLGHVEACIG